MNKITYRTGLIVGAGRGLSASLARRFAKEGMQVALASRDPSKLEALCKETGATAFACDVTDARQVEQLFTQVDGRLPALDVVVFNPSARQRAPLTELDPKEVERALSVAAMGGFLVAQHAAKRMVPRNFGAILFTGASASVKGYAQSAPFAMAKFALRGLAQSMARELAPQGIHVAHFVIDGAIQPSGRESTTRLDAMLDPDAIADTYMHVLQQPRSAWSWEVELRPWTEKF
jgi:NAD(P)-dependent dehydrogenase (short-subunit alcohol dehydrogenase family)